MKVVLTYQLEDMVGELKEDIQTSHLLILTLSFILSHDKLGKHDWALPAARI